MDFAEPCPLVRPGLPLFGFCSSGRSFASALLSDGASRRPPLRLASPLSHRTWAEDLHLQAVKHARHTRPYGNPKAVSTATWKSRTEREIPTFPQPILVSQKGEDEERRVTASDQSLTFRTGKNSCRQPVKVVDIDHPTAARRCLTGGRPRGSASADADRARHGGVHRDRPATS